MAGTKRTVKQGPTPPAWPPTREADVVGGMVASAAWEAANRCVSEPPEWFRDVRERRRVATLIDAVWGIVDFEVVPVDRWIQGD